MSKSNETTPNVPTLRFKEFSGEWEKIRLGNIIEEIKNYTSDFNKYPLYSFTIENGVTPKTDRYERNFLVTKDGDTFKIVPPNSFVMNPMNLRFGAINYSKVKIPVSVSGYYNIFEIENGKNNEFWSAYFLTKTAINLYNSVATGSLIEKKRVHFSQFIQLSFFVPSDVEKQKITRFLQLIENRIAVQNKIISDLKVLKKELCNKVFGKGSAVRLGDFIEEVTTRNKSNSCENVLSVSNKMGFIKQSEQFEDRTVASENKSNYKVVTEGCFAYNPARINVGSIALLSTYKIGIISPMYVCFKTKSNLASEYLNFYYQSGFFYKELQKKLEGSVRQCLTYENMSEILIPYVGIEEQKAIAAILNKFATLIATEEKYLKSLQKQKSYFLNAMFI